ncbi:MAG: alanine--tRNA ligase [Rhizobiales bacterium]|nr:alanine--tRNA ligase [Hyphomicrobiales bacterium]MBL6769777.1 alanine--tRNA ligase [Hyphomicrobiales bacterium]
MITSNEVRNVFLDYFKSKNHIINKSSPLVPLNDPTLLFTNAGMVQFKNFFTGVEKTDLERVVTSQKCVRAGGKHNDLDNVGYTHRHHTFFEMLGNFSFGDYFKEGAIEYAWELITKEYAIPKEKLLVTVFHEDADALNLWKKISGLSDDKIIKINTSDNFWSMGDTGPCGPCSEIFYDHGDHIDGGPPGSPNEDGDRFVEIWNLVFMQYEQVDSSRRIDLPNPSIDTGMGLERMTAVLNGTHSNFDIDIFQSIIDKITNVVKKSPDDDIASYRVIADHLRSTAFLIADGVLPSNEGRGYVLRRICRRATRHADLIGYKKPLLHQLLPTLIETMGEAYPEIGNNISLIKETLEYEETKFRETLSRGLKILNDELTNHSQDEVFSGKTAFKLYDTYGFPLDLTEDLLKAKNMTVDIKTFNAEMDLQKSQTKASWKGSGEQADSKFYFELLNKYPQTIFHGYSDYESTGNVIAIIADEKEVDIVKADNDATLIMDQTIFYAESGGQVADIGELISEDASIRFIVKDVQKIGGSLFLHNGTLSLKSKDLKVGQKLFQKIDRDFRKKISKNHSATHLLHESLRQILGDHISQKGSLVNDKRLRFDFSHQKPIPNSDILEIEKIANYIVMQNNSVETQVMSTDDAMKTGARALFGEKYGKEVRVVSMGNFNDKKFSVELCGGTHVKNTGDIGPIKIMAEQGIASGVRRIEAITGQEAINYLSKQNSLMIKARELLNAQGDDIIEKLEVLIKQKKNIEKELDALTQKNKFKNISDNLEELLIGDINLIYQNLDNVSPKDLRKLMDDTKAKIKSAIIILIGDQDGKKMLIAGVTNDLVDKYSANEIVKIISTFSDIKGGGRNDMAQAGGSNVGEKSQIIDTVTKYIRDKS